MDIQEARARVHQFQSLEQAIHSVRQRMEFAAEHTEYQSMAALRLGIALIERLQSERVDTETIE